MPKHHFLAVALWLAPANALHANPADICDRAAKQVAQETAVPLPVLQTITRVETGRGQDSDLKPWPWTVNMEGRGIWFDTAQQARAYVFRHFKQGARSFDIGCFQINYRWHGHAFKSIDDMFDPLKNARYAARFLTQLHTELGSWTRAAGAYHSRTHKHAEKYLRRYATIQRDLDVGPLRPTNPFPLLRHTSAKSRAGSLVPLGASPARSILSPRPGG